MRPVRTPRAALVAAALLPFAPALRAQPGPVTPGVWDDRFGSPAYVNQALALTLDAEGRLVAAGTLPFAGGIRSRHVVRWTGSRWVNLGRDNFQGATLVAAGPGGALAAVVSVGGALTVARYDGGTTWTDLGTVAAAERLAVGPAGQVCVFGGFTAVGAVAAARAACHDGAGWAPLGTGFPAGATFAAAAFDAAGRLVVGGAFATAGGVAVNGLARWTGAAWERVGAGPAGATTADFKVSHVAFDAEGRLVVGATFPYPSYGDYANVQRFDGATWTPLGTNGSIYGALFGAPRFDELVVEPDGAVLVKGAFPFGPGNAPLNRWARWNGAAWAEARPAGLANADLTTRYLVRADGGRVAYAASTLELLRLDGGVWREFGDGTRNQTTSLGAGPDGSVYAASGFARGGVLRWTGDRWAGLGAGLSVGPSLADCVGACAVSAAVLPNGDVVAVGTFRKAGGAAALYAARWNGAAWSAMGPAPGVGFDVTAGPDGSVYARFEGFVNGSSAPIPYRWTGSAWARMGTAVVGPMAAGPDGTLYASVSAVDPPFRNYGVVRWTGTDWAAHGPAETGLGGSAIHVAPSGRLYLAATVCGGSSTCGPNHVRVLDGGVWTTLGAFFNRSGANEYGAADLRAFAEDAAGGVVVGGRFTRAYLQPNPLTSDPYVPVRSLARWTGSAWEDVGGGVRFDSARSVTGTASVAALLRQGGTLWTGGFFHKVGADVPADGVTRFASNALPVELVAFTATAAGSAVRLAWATASETANAGFGVEHRTGGTWREVAFVPGRGTTAERHAYAHEAKNLGAGRHAFRLRQTDLDGAAHYSAEVEVDVVAGRLALGVPTPNPARTRAVVTVETVRAGRVVVRLYDALGRAVTTAFDGERAPGVHPVGLDVGGLAPGVYVVRLEAEGNGLSRPLVVAR